MAFMKFGWKKYGYKSVKDGQIDWRTGREKYQEADWQSKL